MSSSQLLALLAYTYINLDEVCHHVLRASLFKGADDSGHVKRCVEQGNRQWARWIRIVTAAGGRPNLKHKLLQNASCSQPELVVHREVSCKKIQQVDLNSPRPASVGRRQGVRQFESTPAGATGRVHLWGPGPRLPCTGPWGWRQSCSPTLTLATTNRHKSRMFLVSNLHRDANTT